MDHAYVTAAAALVGSMIGGLTSMAASWMTQSFEFKAQQVAQDRSRRTEVYKAFIDEAARCYADAFEHDKAEISSLVNLYALVSRMRVLSSPKIVESADHVVRVIIETALGPNRSFRDVLQILDNDAMNPLREFSAACREELQSWHGRGSP
jgi:hypothetical protein